MLYAIIIFIIVVFAYSHVMREYKTSHDLEIYELDYTTPQELQSVCNLKQPMIFDFSKTVPSFFSKINTAITTTKCPTELNIYDCNDVPPQAAAEPFAELSLSRFENLIITDSKKHFITENNADFIDDCGSMYETFENLDEYFKDYFVVKKAYDILMGSAGAATPLRFHKNSRQFYVVTEGKIRVKMTPHKNARHLHSFIDYRAFVFGSPVNVWDTQAQYVDDIAKIDFLEFDVAAGSVFYLPPYWWCSIMFVDDKTVVAGATYWTLQNVAANAVDLFQHWRERGDGDTTAAGDASQQQNDGDADVDADTDISANNHETTVVTNE